VLSTAQADTIYVDDDNCLYLPDSDCCIANGTPGCDDLACEAIVCGINPLCCDVVWYSSCSNAAMDLCEKLCTPILEGGSGTADDPFCSIQTAIDNAAHGDEIIVAPGTYLETISFLGKAITLRSSEGPDVSIIDARGAGTVVVCVSGEGSGTVLDGFTITGGTGTPFEADPGYFILVGGGMYNFGSSPTVINCMMSGNTAYEGGGMHNRRSNPSVYDCTFADNVTFESGGGMANVDGSAATIVDCVFVDNRAGLCAFECWGHGGGLYNLKSSPTVTGCTFIGNGATLTGGGMANIQSSPMVIDCSFYENAASLGGGLSNLSSSNPLVAYCSLTGNRSGGFGGGMLNNSSSPVVTNCAFVANSAGSFSEGGGMYNIASAPTIVSSTFRGNAAGRFGDGGGAMCNRDGSVAEVTNCILWDNDADEILNLDTSEAIVRYCVVMGGFTGPHNIDADPMFVDPDNGDFRLSAGSPCIDAGDNTAVPQGVLRDLDGNARFVADACAGDGGATVDMGAYEFQGTSCDLGNVMAMLASWGSCRDCGKCQSDFDGDCSVGILDLLILLGNWAVRMCDAGHDRGHRHLRRADPLASTPARARDRWRVHTRRRVDRDALSGRRALREALAEEGLRPAAEARQDQ